MSPPRLHLHFITLFPEPIEAWLRTSILGRAYEAGLFAYAMVQLRDFATDRYRSVDDSAYGGGGGMVLRIEPLVAAVERTREAITTSDSEATITTICFSPAGRKLDQETLDTLQPTMDRSRQLILVCGHYEGIDQRFIDGWIDYEVSLGDFVLTGGELPAVALADALIRQQKGALGSDTGSEIESFRLKDGSGDALLEFPHYTRPADFRGHRVPDVLLSGNHAEIERWRLAEATARTRQRRPDLLRRSSSLNTD